MNAERQVNKPITSSDPKTSSIISAAPVIDKGEALLIGATGMLRYLEVPC